MNKIPNDKALVIFDDECIICNSAVNFIIKYDRTNKFIFTSFQSDFFKNILDINIDNSSLCVIERDKVLFKSSAVFLLLDYLTFPFKNIFYLFRFLPKKFNDWIYEIIAKNRYRFFPKLKKCDYKLSRYSNRFLL